MESIKEFKKNKIRPGTTYVPGFTLPGNNDDLRSIDVNGNEMRFTPNSRYYASCKIMRGQAVSIAMLDDLTSSQKENKFAYVKLTDPDIDETCLGIAVNSVEEGEIVTIQNRGKFNYYSTTSILNTPQRRQSELFLDTDLWNFNTVRGQKLYVKKVYDNSTNAQSSSEKVRDQFVDEKGDSFDTDQTDETREDNALEGFTYDFIDSVFNVKNTIQIGYLTDAPYIDRFVYKAITKTKDGKTYTSYQGMKKENGSYIELNDYKEGVLVYAAEDGSIKVSKDCSALDSFGFVKTFKTNDPAPKPNEVNWVQARSDGYFDFVDDLLVTIELEVTGDTRGPIDNTQFIVTLGESIYFHPKKQDIELNSFDQNEGVFDEVKVLALSTGEKESPTFRFFFRSETPQLEQGFIGFRKIDGNTCIIPVCSPNLTLKEMCGGLINPQDEGYWKLSCAFTTFDQRSEIAEVEVENPSIKILDNLTDPKNQLKEAAAKALEFVYINDETGSKECHVKTTDIGKNGFEVSLEEKEGFFDVYISESLLPYITFDTVSNGNSAPKGTAILADIRNSSRTNVIGVVLSNSEGIRKKGSRVKVMKMGRMITSGNVCRGKQYYLGLNGRITTREQYWYDCNIPVAIAETDNYLIFDINQFPLRDYNGSYPLGYLKPSVKGVSEPGFLLADGVTQYSKYEYAELYEALLQWYSPEELSPSKISDEDKDRIKNIKALSVFEDLYNEVNQLRITQNEHSVRLDNIEELDRAQNQELEIINQINTRQDATLEELKEADNQIRAVIKTIQEKNEAQDKALEDAKKEIEDEIKNKSKELEDSISELSNALNTEVEERKEDVANLQNQIKDLQDFQKETTNTLANIASDISDIRDNLQTHSNKLETLDNSLKDLSSDYSSFKEEYVKDKESLVSQIQTVKSDLEQEIKDAQDDFTSKIEEVKTSLQGVKENLESKINEVNLSITEISSKIDSLWLEDENGNVSGGVIYNTILTSEKVLTDEINELSNTLSDITENQDIQRNDIDTLSTNLEKWKEDSEKTYATKEESANLYATKEELKSDSDKTSEVIKGLNEDLETKKTEIENLQQKTRNLEDQLSDLIEMMQTWNEDYTRATFDASLLLEYLTGSIDLSNYKKILKKNDPTSLVEIFKNVDETQFEDWDSSKENICCVLGDDVYLSSENFNFPEDGKIVLDYALRIMEREVEVTFDRSSLSLSNISNKVASGSKQVKDKEWTTRTSSYWDLLNDTWKDTIGLGEIPNADELLEMYLFNGDLLTDTITIGGEDVSIIMTLRPTELRKVSTTNKTVIEDLLNENLIEKTEGSYKASKTLKFLNEDETEICTVGKDGIFSIGIKEVEETQGPEEDTTPSESDSSDNKEESNESTSTETEDTDTSKDDSSTISKARTSSTIDELEKGSEKVLDDEDSKTDETSSDVVTDDTNQKTENGEPTEVVIKTIYELTVGSESYELPETFEVGYPVPVSKNSNSETEEKTPVEDENSKEENNSSETEDDSPEVDDVDSKIEDDSPEVDDDKTEN